MLWRTTSGQAGAQRCCAPTQLCSCGVGFESGGLGVLFRCRRLAEMEVGEEDKVGDEGADGIDEGIPGGGGAAGDEGLVDFVEAGIADGDDEGGDAPGPVPAGASAADRAEKQNAEDEIFGEVGALSDDVVDVNDLAVREVGQEPAE